jgi:hypothetical protein
MGDELWDGMNLCMALSLVNVENGNVLEIVVAT